MTQVLRLEPRLTHDASIRLWDAFRENRDDNLELDASDVRHVSASALQVFLVAHRFARQNGRAFEFLAPSSAFEEKLRLLGAEKLLSGDMA